MTTTAWLHREGGRIAYDVAGEGPLVLCVPGIGDLRAEYRFLAPILLEQGFRVATMDLRGHGESSTDWQDFSAEAIGRDIEGLIGHLDAGPAIVIGTSMAAGAGVWAADEVPQNVSGLVLIGPFVRDVGSPSKMRVSRALFSVLLSPPWGLSAWMRYWASLFPTAKPPDFDDYAAKLRRNLGEPGRFRALRRMMLGPSRREIEAALDRVTAPALVIMGTKDRDFPEPESEAELIASRLRGRRVMVQGGGHYPHVEFPGETARLILDFALTDARRAGAAAELEGRAGT